MLKQQIKHTNNTHFLSSVIFILLLIVPLASHPHAFPNSESPTNEPVGVNRSENAQKDEIPYEQTTDKSMTNRVTSGNKSGSKSVVATPLALSKKEITANEFVKENVLGSYIVANGVKYPLREYKPALSSTDPLAGQWWEAELGLEEAWDSTTGNSDTIIAIIDTGFALMHEEFTDRWYNNPGEVGPASVENPSQYNCSDRSISLDESCNLIDDDFDGIVDNETGPTTLENESLLNCSDQSLTLQKSCNLVDDDGNGLVDDWQGWDFVNFDRSVNPGETNPSGSGTRHGTYVAAAAAASGQNNVGIAGVNWQAQILPIQAIDDDGYGNSVTVARSIRYAVNQGADVINLSLGGAFPDAFLQQTIREAMKAGVVVVAASGNNGCDCVSYPANYPEVIAVGALNESRTRASFSSYGSNLDVLAPGVNFTTASWSATNQTSLYTGGINGTSLATPVVSGVIALLKDTLPSASTTELVAILTETADPLTIAPDSVKSTTLGHGTLDVSSVIQRSLTPRNLELITSYHRVSHGNTLLSSGYNADSAIVVYQCENSFANTPVYKVSKGSHIFYTASLTEYIIAQQSGYSSSLLAYLCVVQPHDLVTNMRTLNLGLEFENTFRKQ